MNADKPIFIQIMEMIEDDIISGVYKVDDFIISTNQISKLLSVNPTTSVKAISNLTDSGILYKKRGMGMCVAKGAKEKILARRKEEFFNNAIPILMTEAKKLGLTQDDILEMIKEWKC